MLAVLLLPAAPAMAVDFTVSVAADTHDAVPGDGLCEDVNTDCSLRAAVEESNALSGSDDAIDLPTGDYLLDGSLGALFIGSGGALDINGASARDTTIRQETDAGGDGLDRVFDVGGAATAAIRHGDDCRRSRHGRCRVLRRQHQELREPDARAGHDQGWLGVLGRRHLQRRRLSADRGQHDHGQPRP